MNGNYGLWEPYQVQGLWLSIPCYVKSHLIVFVWRSFEPGCIKGTSHGNIWGIKHAHYNTWTYVDMYAMYRMCLQLSWCVPMIKRWGAGQLLSNHVAVETDWNVRRFDREGLRQLLMKTFAVEASYISICFNCYVIAQQLPHPYLCRSNGPLPNY